MAATIRLKELREARGMTQTSLALRIGVSQAAVSQWEKGIAVPHFPIWPKLEEALGCSINELNDHKDCTAMKIRLRIKELREEREMSQGELAKKLCYSNHAVSKWERGLTLPTIDTLVVIADVFGCTLDDLVERQKEE